MAKDKDHKISGTGSTRWLTVQTGVYTEVLGKWGHCTTCLFVSVYVLIYCTERLHDQIPAIISK